MTSIRLDRGDMQSIRFALRRTARSTTECDDLIPLADQLSAVDQGTLTDGHVSTVTVPEAAWEALVDLHREVGALLAIEDSRRRYATLEMPPKAITASEQLYDHLTALMREHAWCAQRIAGVIPDTAVDAEVADR
jgi:hypothetical protein